MYCELVLYIWLIQGGGHLLQDEKPHCTGKTLSNPLRGGTTNHKVQKSSDQKMFLTKVP